MSRMLIVASVFALAVPAAGCGSSPPPPAPPPPAPPVVAEGEPAEVVVEAEPPPPPPVQVEVVPAAPGAEWYWTPGYHRWWHGQYVWVAGRYQRRPYAAAVWAPAHWEVRGRSHVWVEARWR